MQVWREREVAGENMRIPAYVWRDFLYSRTANFRLGSYYLKGNFFPWGHVPNKQDLMVKSLALDSLSIS